MAASTTPMTRGCSDVGEPWVPPRAPSFFVLAKQFVARLRRAKPGSAGNPERLLDCFQSAHADRASASTRARLAARDDRPAVGLGDRRADDHRPNRSCPVDGAADPLDAADAGAHAGDEGDPAEVQGRQEAPAGRADEVLPGEPDQPGCVLPAAGASDPGFLRALLRPTRVLEASAAGVAF